MKIALAAMDTRGGVQPYVALGVGLARAGHEVRMIAPEDSAPMIAAAGLRHHVLEGSVETALRGSSGAAERGMLASMRFAAQQMEQRIRGWTASALDACAGVDVVSGGVGGMVVALSVAEKLGKPFVPAHLQPLGAPTDAYPGVLFPRTPRWLGGWATRASHHLSELGVWMPFEPAMKSARRSVLGLTGKPSAADWQPVLYGFSRRVVDVPSDARTTRHVTGYWTLDAERFVPPPALSDFLAQQGPIVSIGFGSMASDSPEATAALVLAAIRKEGVRAVLLSGWGGMRAHAASDVFVAEALPHDWLFPRTSAVVHHGGAGTTGAALRAGVPAIVVPFTMDQPFWGARVAALGVGPEPIPRKKLTRDALATALRIAVSDAAMRERAHALGVALRAEDGVGAAVKCFESIHASA
jgi:UDP:flavonoid glycosyltransferase YjiC (YdhE family)